MGENFQSRLASFSYITTHLLLSVCPILLGLIIFTMQKKNKNNVPFKGATWDIMQVYRGIIRRFSDRDYKCIFSSFVIRLLLTAKKENG